MPAILEFPPTRTAREQSYAPDLAFATLPLLNRLRDALAKAVTALDEYRIVKERSTRKQRMWGVPKLFFFHKPAQIELLAGRASGGSPHEAPSLANDSALSDLLEDAHLLLAESLDVRRAARATPGLYDAAKILGTELAPAKQLAELLRMPEGEAIRVIHPAAGAGYRVLTQGVATVNQFHTLFADRITGDPERGFLPGMRPSADAVNAAGEVDPFAGEETAEARFQFLRPTALTEAGTIPEGFRSSAHWFWGEESLAEFPLDNGERVVLIDEPTIANTWVVERKFPRLPAEIEVLEVMKRAEVQAWLRKRCPAYAPTARRVRDLVAA
jgi:hypothetical protein